jgi:hypothetical protein
MQLLLPKRLTASAKLALKIASCETVSPPTKGENAAPINILGTSV